MALYDRRFDQRTGRSGSGTLLPFILAAAVAAILIMMMLFPRPAARVGDAGMPTQVDKAASPTMKTTTPGAAAPSTEPAMPMQPSGTEPRPTQAPNQ